MMFAANTPDPFDALEGEFIPPVGALLTESYNWGIPWERQLEAALAWQSAGGNVDNEWDHWVAEQAFTAPAVAMATAKLGASAPTMATVVRMTTSLVSLRERLFRIQSEATGVARSEMRLRRASLPQAANGSGPSAVRRPLGDDNGRRITALARGCIDLLESTRAAMAALTMDVASAGVERRQQRVVIDFPDRRVAG